MTTIYTLELENGKYYIGKSNIPKQRILQHFKEEGGSEWTKMHKPVKVLSQIKGDAFDEEKYTLIAMDKYGIDNVRGGSYCKVNLTQDEKDKALQTIRSITDKCYKCGKKGHFAKDCQHEDEDDEEDEFDDPQYHCQDCHVGIQYCRCGYCHECGWCCGRGDNCDGSYCGACNGSGIGYWSDDCYGSCLECCCINCGKKNRGGCGCYECEKCKDIITKDENHNCSLFLKCNN
jgi:cellular nucleic acid-binding protein